MRLSAFSLLWTVCGSRHPRNAVNNSEFIPPFWIIIYNNTPYILTLYRRCIVNSFGSGGLDWRQLTNIVVFAYYKCVFILSLKIQL